MADADDPKRDSRPDWKKSVSMIVSPIVSVRKPSGEVERTIDYWKVLAWVLLLISLATGVFYLLHSEPPPPGDGPLF